MLKHFLSLNKHCQSHPATWIEASDLGKTKRQYAPTYPFKGDYINNYHHSFLTMPRKNGGCGLSIESSIEGWLQPADAMKIYELAYFCKGNIGEWGTYHGLSTSIILRAIKDSERNNKVWTVDIDQPAHEQAKQHLSSASKYSNLTFMTDDGMRAFEQCLNDKVLFNFMFIDHSHHYQHMLPLCQRLHEAVRPGGFCLFHDFNDRRNHENDGMPENDFGVYLAVKDGLSAEHFEFYGIYGACGLYRRN